MTSYDSRRRALILLLITSVCWPAAGLAQDSGADTPDAAARRPPSNVVLIVADDLGWADLGSYGNTVIETPNLDRLAAEGMRFTDAYAPAPICSASRAALLTGRSPARLHFEFVTKPDGSERPLSTPLEQPPYPRDLPLQEVTLAEEMNDAYVSGFFGKWHLTQENERYLGWGDSHGPLQQGFQKGDATFGSHPYAFRFSGRSFRGFGDDDRDRYPVDTLTQEAIHFVRDNRQSPFLLVLSHYYVHTPVHNRVRWLHEKYRAKLGKDGPDESIQYAAFVETMDAYVGQLLDAIDAYGLRDNTIVIFTSDNGGHPAYTDNGALRGSKWNLYEGGIRVPLIVRWPRVVAPASVSDVPVIGTDLLPTVLELTGSIIDSAIVRDGRSLVPLLTGGPNAALDRPMYWHFPFYHPAVVDTKPQSALRVGDQKLIYFYEEGRAELYDLRRDLSESRDLSRFAPERAHELTGVLFELLKTAGARLPTPGR